MAKNLCGKMRDKSNPYEVWQSFDGSWTWNVLKKWQADDSKPYARWFCNVVTPICPDGELGDVYASEIMNNARRIDAWNGVSDDGQRCYVLSRPAKW